MEIVVLGRSKRRGEYDTSMRAGWYSANGRSPPRINFPTSAHVEEYGKKSNSYLHGIAGVVRPQAPIVSGEDTLLVGLLWRDGMGFVHLLRHYPWIVYLGYSFWRKLLVRFGSGTCPSHARRVLFFTSPRNHTFFSRAVGIIGHLRHLSRWEWIQGPNNSLRRLRTSDQFVKSLFRHDQIDCIRYLVLNERGFSQRCLGWSWAYHSKVLVELLVGGAKVGDGPPSLVVHTAFALPKRSPLHHAMKQRNFEVVDFLISQGATDPQVVLTSDQSTSSNKE